MPDLPDGPELVALAVTTKRAGEMTEVEMDEFLSSFVAEMFAGTDHPQAAEAQAMAEEARQALEDEQEGRVRSIPGAEFD